MKWYQYIIKVTMVHGIMLRTGPRVRKGGTDLYPGHTYRTRGYLIVVCCRWAWMLQVEPCTTLESRIDGPHSSLKGVEMDRLLEILSMDGDTEYTVLLETRQFACITRVAGPEEDRYHVASWNDEWYLNGTFRECVLECQRRASK